PNPRSARRSRGHSAVAHVISRTRIPNGTCKQPSYRRWRKTSVRILIHGLTHGPVNSRQQPPGRHSSRRPRIRHKERGAASAILRVHRANRPDAQTSPLEVLPNLPDIPVDDVTEPKNLMLLEGQPSMSRNPLDPGFKLLVNLLRLSLCD